MVERKHIKSMISLSGTSCGTFPSVLTIAWAEVLPWTPDSTPWNMYCYLEPKKMQIQDVGY